MEIAVPTDGPSEDAKEETAQDNAESSACNAETFPSSAVIGSGNCASYGIPEVLPDCDAASKCWRKHAIVFCCVSANCRQALSLLRESCPVGVKISAVALKLVVSHTSGTPLAVEGATLAKSLGLTERKFAQGSSTLNGPTILHHRVRLQQEKASVGVPRHRPRSA